VKSVSCEFRSTIYEYTSFYLWGTCSAAICQSFADVMIRDEAHWHIHHTERRKLLCVDKLLISTHARTDIDSVAVLSNEHVVAEVLNVSRCVDVYCAFVVLLWHSPRCLSVYLCILIISFDFLRSYRSNEALLSDVGSGVTCVVYNGELSLTFLLESLLRFEVGTSQFRICFGGVIRVLGVRTARLCTLH